MLGHNATAPAGGSTDTARARRRAAAGLACAAIAVAATAGCDPSSSGQATATPTASAAAATASASAASADHACSAALTAVSDYGPTVIKDAIAGHETLDKIEINLLVTVLKGAAAATGNPGVKQSITSLADDYLKLKDSLHGQVDAAVERQVDNGAAHLKQQCRSS
jgi:hypothetical protein